MAFLKCIPIFRSNKALSMWRNLEGGLRGHVHTRCAPICTLDLSKFDNLVANYLNKMLHCTSF